MKIGPKYKIARRLNTPVFEKTQTQKFTLSQTKKGKEQKRKFPKKQSEYGLQLLEKQKARYSYLLSEKQFSKYIKEAVAKKGRDTSQAVLEKLEMRLDNAVFRLGFFKTRGFARQAVSHGHILVNGRKVTIPSYRLSIGDKISIREQSKNKGLFTNLEEVLKESPEIPYWLKFDLGKKEAEVKDFPKIKDTELMFNLDLVIEFYSR